MESVLTMPPDLIAEDRTGQWRLRRYLIYLVSALALAGCAPTALSLAVDGAYTASEERTLDDVVDDNGIKLELNKLLLEDGLGLFKDVGTATATATGVAGVGSPCRWVCWIVVGAEDFGFLFLRLLSRTRAR